MTADGVEFRILGNVDAIRNGHVLALGGAQQRRLLAVLLTEPDRAVSIDRLIETMWDGDAPTGARRTLMSYVSRLRRELGAGAVELVGDGYRLVTGGAVDALRFERQLEVASAAPPSETVAVLDDALGLWRGRAFGDLAGEWWALPHATRLDDLRLTSVEARCDALLTIGRIDDARGGLTEQLAVHPLRSGLVVRLARAYAADGRDADALRAISAHRRRLVEETGLDPPPAVAELEQRLLAGAGAEHIGRSARGYRLGERLGAGAHGTVYRSHQPGVGREVAVKVVRPEFADDPTFINRFEQEARLVSRLEHPHIVPLYDFWREPGGAFLVFRLMSGGTLQSARSVGGSWELPRVSRLLLEIGDALVLAHRSGVVHRDVKPSNILLDDDGHAYLSDFGIATLGRAIEQDLASSPASSSPYTSPEMRSAGGEARSDQYSLAAVGLELLTGDVRRPVRGSGVVEAVLRRAMRHAVDERFASVEAMLDAWRVAVGGADEEPRVIDDGREPVNPYPGLRAFAEVDAPNFCGRSLLLAQLSAKVASERFVALVGASGSGKSSLLRAGLLPELRAAGAAVVDMVPGAEPFERFRLALATVALAEPVGSGLVALVESGRPTGPLVVVVDQFEELWTTCDAARRTSFVEQLCTVVSSAVGCTVVIALRADFYDRPLAVPEFGQLVAANTVAVSAMPVADLREAIVAPAARAGVRLARDLEAQLIADAIDRPGSLPLLQFTLHEMFERKSDRLIDLATYDALGGTAGAVAGRAEELYITLAPVDADATRRLLLRLVVAGDGTGDTGRRLPRSELPAGTATMADTLSNHRLVTIDVDPATREPTYELAHESLVTAWPRLGLWLDESRIDRRVLQQLNADAAGWDDGGRKDTDLSRGPRLDGANDVATRRPDELAPVEEAFLEASRTAAAESAAAEQRVKRRLRRRLQMTSVALALVVVAGGIAFWQRQEAAADADAAAVARLVALSQSLVTSKRDVAALVALAASQRDPSAATDGAMMTALYTDPSFLGDLGPPEVMGDVVVDQNGTTLWSSTGQLGGKVFRVDPERASFTPFDVPDLGDNGVRLIASAGDAELVLVFGDGDGGAVNQVVRVVDVERGRTLRSVDAGSPLASLRMDPTGTRVAATTVGDWQTPATTLVYDVASLTEVAAIVEEGPIELDEGRDWFSAPAWVDDSTIAVGSTSGRIQVVDVDSGAVVSRFNDSPDANVGQVAQVLTASRDGRRLVATDYAADGLHGRGLMAFDVATGDPLWSEPRPGNPGAVIDSDRGLVYAVEAGPGSSRVFAYDLETGERRDDKSIDGQRGSNCGLVIAPSTNRLFLPSCNSESIGVWALDGSTIAGAPLAGPGWSTGWNMWSFDGSQVALYNPENQMVVRDVATGELRVAPPGLDYDAWSWFLPDGRMLSVRPREDVVIVSDGDQREIRRIGVDMPDDPVGMAWTPDGGVLVVGDAYLDDTRVFDLTSGTERFRLTTDGGPSRGVDITPDGTRVFVGTQSEVTVVIDGATGDRIGELANTANVTVAPDGSVVAGSSFDGTITFYDPASLEVVGAPLSGSTSFSNSVQFTFDSRYLITSGLDNTQRIWDIESRRQIGPGIPITSWTVAMTPDSSTIAANTADGVRVFDLERDRLRDLTCRAAGRNLTDEEWDRYIGGTPVVLCP